MFVLCFWLEDLFCDWKAQTETSWDSVPRDISLKNKLSFNMASLSKSLQSLGYWGLFLLDFVVGFFVVFFLKKPG